MNTKTAKRGKIVSVPSLYETLRQMELGMPQKFSVRQFKVGAVRAAVSALRKKNFDFEVTEVGMLDEYVVTRLK